MRSKKDPLRKVVIYTERAKDVLILILCQCVHIYVRACVPVFVCA